MNKELLLTAGEGVVRLAAIAMACAAFFFAGCAVLTGAAMGAANVIDAHNFSKTRPDYKLALQHAGDIGPGDIFPRGKLYAAMGTTGPDDTIDRTALLVVNFDALSGEGERSYIAHGKVNCASGIFTIVRFTTSSMVNGNGSPIHGAEHSPHLQVRQPSEPVRSALAMICKAP